MAKPKRKKTFLHLINKQLHVLNNSKFFAGIIMLIMNIGSKYVTLQLSESQEDYIKYTLGRQVLVFAILWMGTRDIVISLLLTTLFIVFADYLFNDSSKFCIIPENCKTVSKNNNNDDKQITTKNINDAIDTLKKARQLKCSENLSKIEDHHIKKSLYKENFI
jgi:hypothetical protein